MIAGASWTWWLGFHLVVIGLLVADWLLHRHGGKDRSLVLMAWVWTGFLFLLSLGFAGWIAFEKGRQPALEFIGGYAIESSLSVDNLVVFLAIFRGFGVTPRGQNTALRWGVFGAILMRALFIAAGIALIQHFTWVTWIFGLILLYAAWHLAHENSAKSVIPGPIAGWVRRMQPEGQAYSNFGSLLPVIIAVEFTDLLFAVDSIPAVLAISRNPFVVYTSNIAAILGLRTLYIAMSSLLDRIRYLHYGLGALLVFVAFKMLAAHWIEVPITISLIIMGAILVICAVASWIAGNTRLKTL
jgi:tellurite resistance protein TerC